MKNARVSDILVWVLGGVFTSAVPVFFVIVYDWAGNEFLWRLPTFLLDILMLSVNLSAGALVLCFQHKETMSKTVFYFFICVLILLLLFSWGFYITARSELEKYQNNRVISIFLVIISSIILLGVFVPILSKYENEEHYEK